MNVMVNIMITLLLTVTKPNGKVGHATKRKEVWNIQKYNYKNTHFLFGREPLKSYKRMKKLIVWGNKGEM